MGIPYYFYTIINQCQDILIDKCSQCSRLFLDFNSIIHNTAYALLQKEQDVDTHIYKDIIDYVDSIVSICTPTDLLYIAIDGVAPCAKMHQQRKRRYMTSYRNQMMSAFKAKNGIESKEWDSNQITPGTEFMKKLNVYLNDHYKQNPRDFQVIVSGSNEPMEGEHKFIRYIKENPNKDQNKKDVIYGLDADLIMLSLTCESPNIYLMRESTNFQTIKTSSGLTETTKSVCFKYLDIDKLRRSISEYLYNSDEVSYMNDYVFICFFLGNDFLPNFPFLKLKYSALDILCDTYKCVHHKLNKVHIIEKKEDCYSINFEFLKMFLEHLGNVEDKYMQDITNEYDSCKYNTNRRPTNKVDKFMLDLDNYPIMNSMTSLINPIKDNKWRLSYYHYLFPDIQMKDVKNICYNFIEGLQWNMNYYFNRTYSTNWYYKYGYSPSAFDLYNNLCIISLDEFENIGRKVSSSENDIKIDEEMQLMMVLPPQSIKIMPEKMQKIISNIEYGCCHYYPYKFTLTTYLKYHLWECVPVLPEFNIHHLKEILSKIK